MNATIKNLRRFDHLCALARADQRTRLWDWADCQLECEPFFAIWNSWFLPLPSLASMVPVSADDDGPFALVPPADYDVGPDSLRLLNIGVCPFCFASVKPEQEVCSGCLLLCDGCRNAASV